ncbi:MAG TPA: alpha/beta hydrolase [Allosphingosinicella sp.]
MTAAADTPLAPDFRRVAAARRLFGRPDFAAARADPAAARTRQHRLVAATGGVASNPVAEAGDRLVAVPSGAPRPGLGPILYIHGGGLVFYDVAIYRPWLQLIADGGGRDVIAIDYPRAPETAPAAVLAAVAAAAAEAAASAPGLPVLAGDSVGGLIALWLCAQAGVVAERLVLIAPMLNLREDRRFDSYAAYGAGYGLDAEFMPWFRALVREALPDFDPLGPEPFAASLPERTAVASPACDLLADEAAAFAGLMAQRGSPIERLVLAGLPHDFWLYPGFAPVREASRRVAALCGAAAD